MATPTGIGSGVESATRAPQEVLSASDDAFDTAFRSEADKADSTPAAPEGSNPEATAAPDVKAQEAGASNAPSEAKPGDEPPEFKNLLAKYNGDRAAAGKAYWETNNRAAELARKNEELSRELEAAKAGSNPPATPQQTQTEQQLGPELRWYQQNILSVEKNYQAKNTEQTNHRNEVLRLRQEESSIRRQLRSNDLSLDKDKLNSQLIDVLDRKDQHEQYVDQLQSQLDGLDGRWQELQANQEQVKRTLTLERQLRQDREAKDRASEETQTLQFRTSWNGTIDAVSKDVSAVPATSAAAFGKFVRAKGKAQVADGEPIMDVEKFVRDAAAEFKGMLEAESNARFANYSKGKNADTTLSAPTGKAATTPETKAPRSTWTPQQWDQFHEENPPF